VIAHLEGLQEDKLAHFPSLDGRQRSTRSG
jgi:hypothetical protein